MEYIDRPVTVHYSVYAQRPIVGGVLHDTESTGPLTVDQSLGSWHWLVGRDGAIYCDVSEEHVAWHVAAGGTDKTLNRWLPTWLIPCPDSNVSAVNYCTLGVELVSNQTYRDAGEPYTAAQYDALATLVADIEGRYGSLPWVGHGELQTDRTDPVGFDWTRAGFGPRTAEGRRVIHPSPAPTPTPTPTPQEGAMLTDDALDAVLKDAWASVAVDYNPDTAIAKAYREELRADRCPGIPNGPEGTTELADGTELKWQCFPGRLAIYKPGAGVTWRG